MLVIKVNIAKLRELNPKKKDKNQIYLNKILQNANEVIY